MEIELRAFEPDDLDAVVDLSLRAWEPNFNSFPDLVGAELAATLHPDWRTEQAQVVRDGCETSGHRVEVAVVEEEVVGFAVVVMDAETSIGELHLLAVDPAHQRNGVARSLNDWALDAMRTAGMRMATVGTGGDASHAPARRSYERAGYVPIPVVHYFQMLSE